MVGAILIHKSGTFKFSWWFLGQILTFLSFGERERERERERKDSRRVVNQVGSIPKTLSLISLGNMQSFSTTGLAYSGL